MISNMVRYGVFYAGLALALTAMGVMSFKEDLPMLAAAVGGHLPASTRDALELVLEGFVLALGLAIAGAVLLLALGVLLYFMARFRIYPDALQHLAKTITDELREGELAGRADTEPKSAIERGLAKIGGGLAMAFVVGLCLWSVGLTLYSVLYLLWTAL